MSNWNESGKRVLRCIQCGELYPGTTTNDGDFVPVGVANGGRCHKCGSDKFEQVALTPPD